ncbi:MAG: BatD family protein [Phycisphaerales bacterium]|nr:BatD family protein [Phycisphaerales bacterium]
MRLLVVIVSMLASLAGAQPRETVVSAQVNPERSYVGGLARYSVVIEGEGDIVKPQVSFPAGVTPTYAGSQFMPPAQIVINGRRVDGGPARTVYQWSIAFSRAGEFIIPPAVVVVGGEERETNAVRVTVVEPERADDFALRASLSSSVAYVGEPIELTLRWMLGREPTDYSIQGWIDETDAQVLAPDGDDWMTGRAQADIPFLSGIARASVYEEDVGGEQRTIVEVRRVLVPLRPGPLDIGPFRAVFRAPSLDNPSRFQRYSVASETLTLEVKPVPTAGRPANFSGLVRRRLAVAVTATPARVHVGDPITLTVTIGTDAPLTQVEAPNLARQPGFTDAFKLDPGGWEETGTPRGARAFTSRIRARSDTLTSIPPVEVCYFNPESETFEVAASRPIGLTVQETKEITAADAVIGAPEGDDSGRGLRTSLQSAVPGLIANEHGSAVLRRDSPDPISHLAPATLIGLLAGPPALCVGAAGLAWWRSPGQRAWRRRAFAHRRALGRMARARGEPGALNSALCGYVADRFDRTAAALTERDCRELLGEGPQVEAFERVLATCDGARYGGSGSVDESEARKALGDLHRSLKGGRA